eukprot:3458360-Pyramimonas_sp.AAC.1
MSLAGCALGVLDVLSHTWNCAMYVSSVILPRKAYLPTCTMRSEGVTLRSAMKRVMGIQLANNEQRNR